MEGASGYNSLPSVQSGDCDSTTDVPRSDKLNDKPDDKPADIAPDLARVIGAWPDLPEAVKAGILAMVKASR